LEPQDVKAKLLTISSDEAINTIFFILQAVFGLNLQIKPIQQKWANF